MVMDMATTLERDLLNPTTDTHMPLAHTFLLDQLVLLDMEPEPHSLPEAHKDSEARDPLSHTTDMDSTDTDHTDTVQESLDTQVPLPPTLPEAYKVLANRFLNNLRTEVRKSKRKMQFNYLFLLDKYLLTNPILLSF